VGRHPNLEDADGEAFLERVPQDRPRVRRLEMVEPLEQRAHALQRWRHVQRVHRVRDVLDARLRCCRPRAQRGGMGVLVGQLDADGQSSLGELLLQAPPRTGAARAEIDDLARCSVLHGLDQQGHQARLPGAAGGDELQVVRLHAAKGLRIPG
jgi:hypothetical protein